MKGSEFYGHGNQKRKDGMPYDISAVMKGAEAVSGMMSKNNNAPMLAYLTRNAASSATATRIASAFHHISSPTIRTSGILDATVFLKRGDFICAVADSGSTIHGGTDSMNLFQAERVG